MVFFTFLQVVSVASGGLYSFGKNDHGQLGLEGGESRFTPVRKTTSTLRARTRFCAGSSGILIFRSKMGPSTTPHASSTSAALPCAHGRVCSLGANIHYSPFFSLACCLCIFASSWPALLSTEQQRKTVTEKEIRPGHDLASGGLSASLGAENNNKRVPL